MRYKNTTKNSVWVRLNSGLFKFKFKLYNLLQLKKTKECRNMFCKLENVVSFLIIFVSSLILQLLAQTIFGGRGLRTFGQSPLNGGLFSNWYRISYPLHLCKEVHLEEKDASFCFKTIRTTAIQVVIKSYRLQISHQHATTKKGNVFWMN